MGWVSCGPLGLFAFSFLEKEKTPGRLSWRQVADGAASQRSPPAVSRVEVQHRAKHSSTQSSRQCCAVGSVVPSASPARTRRPKEAELFPQGHTSQQVAGHRLDCQSAASKPKLLSAHRLLCRGILMCCSECSLWSQHSWVRIPAPPLNRDVTLSKIVKLPVPQFPLLQNGNAKSNFIGLLRGFT